VYLDYMYSPETRTALLFFLRNFLYDQAFHLAEVSLTSVVSLRMVLFPTRSLVPFSSLKDFSLSFPHSLGVGC